MLDRNALFDKIEHMPIQDLHALLCDVLDESGIDYEIGPGTIPFFRLEQENSFEKIHLNIARTSKPTNVDRKYISLDKHNSQEFIFSKANNINSTEWSFAMRYNAA